MIKVQSIGPNESLSLDPREPGFAYGMAIFESIKVSQGRVYFWSRHWRRFRNSIAKYFSYHCSESDEHSILSAFTPLAVDYGPDDFILKLSFMMRAEGPCVFLYGRPLFPRPSLVSLCIQADHPIDEASVLRGEKTHNYFENIWLQRSAQATGYTDYLRVNRAGQVCETTTANCFFIRDGKVVTAAATSGIIPGVIRECLMEIMGFETSELRLEALHSIEGGFLTNVAVGILPIDRIEGFSDGGSVQFDSVMHPLVKEATDQLKIIASTEATDLDTL